MQGALDPSHIFDTREESDFRGMSFSGFKVSQVAARLQRAYTDKCVEEACFWTAELVAAGHYAKLWEVASVAAASNHATASPRVAILAASHFETFKRLVESGYQGRELELRNNEQIRSMFAELAAVLCTARRQHPTPPVRIRAATDFDMATMAGRLEAPDTSFASAIFKDGDPKELFVAVNEFSFQLTPDQASSVGGCYWVQWIVAFIRHCSPKGGRMEAHSRELAPVPDAHKRDPIWIVWEVLILRANARGPVAGRAVEALLQLYSIKYTPGIRTRRAPVLYAAVSIVTTAVDFTIPAASDPDAISNIVAKGIVGPYRELKKHEVGSGQGQGDSQTNRQKTSARLQRLNALLGADAPKRIQ